jgi:hypothetical protein
LLALNEHEQGAVALLDPVGQLAAHIVGDIFNQTLYMGLGRDHVLVLLIEVVALTLLLNLLRGDLLAKTRNFIDDNQLLLLGQRADLA